jgi:hypothetical protein
MVTLPAKIVERVTAEFADSERPEVLRLLASFGEEGHEDSAERVWTAILDRAQGKLYAVRHFVAVAETDWRDILCSSRNDLHILIDKLLKNLRFTGSLTESEIDAARELWRPPNARDDEAFAFLCRTLGEHGRPITEEQRERIRHIAALLRYPPYSIPFEEHVLGTRKKPWWKF